MNIDDRPQGPFTHFAKKFQMALTLQRVNRSPSCLVLGWGFRRRRISGWIKSKMAAGGQFEKKLQMAVCQQRVIQATSCLVLGSVFREGRMALRYFGFAEIHEGNWRPF